VELGKERQKSSLKRRKNMSLERFFGIVMGFLVGCVLVIFFSATLLSAKLILNAFHRLPAPIGGSVCSVCSGNGNGSANSGGPNSSGSCSSALAPNACEEK
jgi:hypothetical protein